MYVRHAQKLVATTISFRCQGNQWRAFTNAKLRTSDTRERDDDQSPTSSGGYREELRHWFQARRQTPVRVRSATKELSPEKSHFARQRTVIKDPLKLANEVLATLQQQRNFDRARELVHAASQDMIPCTVSWNHLIDWLMSEGRVNDAVKIYNEMKKRAQQPDSHTFTILFRGFANSAHRSQSLEKALSIYHSMLLKRSPVKPNVKHVNAVLKVCSRAGDMDALFGIAAKLPSKGIGSADNITYTTTLNAMNQHILSSLGELKDIEQQRLKAKVVSQAREIWDEVIKRWRSGDMFMDENVVCSMGRLLLTGGTPRDVDDVFSLLQQTMNIPRPFEELGAPSRDRHEPSLQGKLNPKRHGPAASDQEAGAVRDNTKIITSRFAIVEAPPLNDHGNGGYVRPGNNTLSLSMKALLMSSVSTMHWVSHYWQYFTSEHLVEPDLASYAACLRVLRVLRASAQAVALVQKMYRTDLEPKIFRIALSTCARDKNNPHAFDHAGKIFDLMQQTLDEPDLKSLHLYLETPFGSFGTTSLSPNPTTDSPPRVLPTKFTAMGSQQKLALGRRIMSALHRIGPQVKNINSYLAYGSHTKSSDGTLVAQSYLDAQPSVEFLAEALRLFRRIHAAYSKLINYDMVSRDNFKVLNEERYRIQFHITKLQQKLSTKGADYARTSSRQQKFNNRGANHAMTRSGEEAREDTKENMDTYDSITALSSLRKTKSLRRD